MKIKMPSNQTIEEYIRRKTWDVMHQKKKNSLIDEVASEMITRHIEELKVMAREVRKGMMSHKQFVTLLDEHANLSEVACDQTACTEAARSKIDEPTVIDVVVRIATWATARGYVIEGQSEEYIPRLYVMLPDLTAMDIEDEI